MNILDVFSCVCKYFRWEQDQCIVTELLRLYQYGVEETCQVKNRWHNHTQFTIIQETRKTTHYCNDVKHRDEGPAIISVDGTDLRWFYDGLEYKRKRINNDDVSRPPSWERHYAYVQNYDHKTQSKQYFRVLHSDNDQPAVIRGPYVSLRWYKHGVLHRDNDLPAVIRGPDLVSWSPWLSNLPLPHTDTFHHPVIYKWYKHGTLHRDGGKPAVVNVTDQIEMYYQHGKCHNQDAPAYVCRKKGMRIYIQHGQVHSEDDEIPAFQYIDPHHPKTQFLYIYFRHGKLFRKTKGPVIVHPKVKIWRPENHESCQLTLTFSNGAQIWCRHANVITTNGLTCPIHYTDLLSDIRSAIPDCCEHVAWAIRLESEIENFIIKLPHVLVSQAPVTPTGKYKKTWWWWKNETTASL